MENSVRGYFEEDAYDYPEEIEETQEAKREEEKKPKLDAKTWRKTIFVKHRKSRKKESTKSEMSKIAQKKKKEERESKLGASILKARRWQYENIVAKRTATQAS